MAVDKTKNRVKWGYLNYDDIQARIDENKLDAYDVVYTKDTHECYILTEDLTPVSVHSRIYRFNGIAAAITYLNAASDTYEGQVVAIRSGEKYRAYIVNLVDNQYDVELLMDTNQEIDYNTLGNRPIINLSGTLSEPVIVGNLDVGIYSITGQYKIFDSVDTVFSCSVNHIFLVDKSETETLVRDISARKIISYLSDGSAVKENEIITADYLKENNYVTNSSVDQKLQALDILTKAEAKEYIESTVTEYLDAKLNDAIDKKFDEKLTEAQDSAIDEMFMAD